MCESTTESLPTSARQGRARNLLISVLDGGPAALALPIIAAVVVLLVPLIIPNAYWLQQISLIACIALVVSGSNVTFGYAGEIQFGQVFMFAAGAYVTMSLAIRGLNDVLLLLVIGGVVAGVLGLIISVPALRFGGWALAMVSLFLVVVIPELITVFPGVTGGLNGLIGIPAPHLFGHELSSTGLYEAAAVVTIVWLGLYRNLVTSRYGTLLRTLRESPVLTRSLGVSTTRLKTAVYVFGSIPAGLGGCLFGYISAFLEPANFGLNLAVGVTAASILGGVESVYGVLVGAAILQLGPEQSLSFANYAPVAYGLFLLVAGSLLRNGIAGILLAGTRRIRIAVAGQPNTSDVEAGPHTSADAAATDIMRFDGQPLAVRNVAKSYGGVKALDDVTLDIARGTVTALIGSNGSGKTTLLNTVSGYTQANTGEVRLGDRALAGLPAHTIARLGVARTFQTPVLPMGVTVVDAVAAGAWRSRPLGLIESITRGWRYRRQRGADRDEAMRLLDVLGLTMLADQSAATLPLGTRRLVEVARALCGNPGLILLDEPASGLSDTDIARLERLLTAVARAGATVLLVEHNFGFVTRVAQTIHVLHLGQVIASGPGEQIRADPQVIESYLGSSPETESDVTVVATHPRTTPKPAPAAAGTDGHLSIDEVTAGYGDLLVLRDVSLQVGRGQVVALLGRNGAGKTTLLSTVSGLLPVRFGHVRLAGRPVESLPAYQRTALGVAMVQEGKRIFRERSIWENVLIGTYVLRVGRAERTRVAREVLDQFPVLATRRHERAGGLSGGQQQMLAIAQALAARPTALLLDEPSAGLAPAIVADVFERVRALADEGLAVLLVEQLADRAIDIADQVAVLDGGQIVDSGPPERFRDADVLRTAYFGVG